MKTGLADLANRQLYEEYKKRLDARAVLEHYGAENCTETSGGEGTTEVIHSCLLDRVEPHHTHGDRNPSAACNLDKKLYTCYAGGWSGDLFHLIAKLEGKETLAEALPVIGSFLTGATVESAEALEDMCQRLLSLVEVGIADIPTYHERFLRPWSAIHPYLYEERGITIEAATKLQLGFDEQENRVVFPHFWKGKLVGWQKRVIPARTGWPGTFPDYPKYRNSGGFPKAETLYHFDRAVDYDHVIIVESPMSVARAVSLGLDNVIATFGAKVSDLQIRLIAESFRSAWVWFDHDPAGGAGERKLVEGLYRSIDVNVVTPDPGRDLGDATTETEVLTKLDAASPAVLRIGQYGDRR
jgi:hypothetical protein